MLAAGELDGRDIGVVEALSRRAAHLRGVNFGDAVEVGCASAAELGGEARKSLLSASMSTPATHMEEGDGASFFFRRRPVGFDVEELERWLNRGSG